VKAVARVAFVRSDFSAARGEHLLLGSPALRVGMVERGDGFAVVAEAHLAAGV